MLIYFARWRIGCERAQLAGLVGIFPGDSIERIKVQQNLFFAHRVATRNKVYLEHATGAQLGETLLTQRDTFAIFGVPLFMVQVSRP